MFKRLKKNRKKSEQKQEIFGFLNYDFFEGVYFNTIIINYAQL